MDFQKARKWLIDNRYTAYQLTKHIDLSIQGLQDVLNGYRRPQRKTVVKIEDFVLQEMNKNKHKQNVISETIYEHKTVTNNDLFIAIQDLTTALGENAMLVSDLLNKTYQNTKEIHSTIKVIDKNLLNAANSDLSNNLKTYGKQE
jgi:hypothetical protein